MKPHWSVESAHDGWVRGVAFNARATAVVSCGKDGFVRLWERARGRGKMFNECETKTDLLSVAFAPDGSHVFAGDLFGTIHEFAVASGKKTRTFEVKELHKLDRIQDVGGVKTLLV